MVNPNHEAKLVDLDDMSEAMSEDQLESLVNDVLGDAEMSAAAVTISIRVLIEFIGRNELEDQLVGEIRPNEMVALIAATEMMKKADDDASL